MDSKRQDKFKRTVLVGVSIVTIMLSVIGLAYSVWMIYRFSSADTFSRLSSFDVALFLTGALCISCHFLLAMSGVQLIAKKTKWIFVLAAVVLFEVVLYISMHSLRYLDNDYVTIISATWETWSFGFVPQFILLFPVWAPPLGFWASGLPLKRVLLASGIAFPLLGGGLIAFLASQMFSIFEMPHDLEKARVVTGTQLFSKTLFFEDDRLGPITHILMAEPGIDFKIGIAGWHGAVFLGDRIQITSWVRFKGNGGHVEIRDVDRDGVWEYVNRRAATEVSLLDHTGETVWSYGGFPGASDMAAGDVDGDGEIEYVVGTPGSGGVHLLDQRGQVVWRQPDGNVWHVEMVDVDGNGRDEIVHSNVAGQITVRDFEGKVQKRIQPPAYVGWFSVVRWPGEGDRPFLLYSEDEVISVLDVRGQVVKQLPAPLSRNEGDVRGMPVRFKSDQPAYFAALVTHSYWHRSILYIYDAALKLVYQEILDEAGSSLATQSVENSDREMLLIGGEGRVWQYE